MHSVFLTVHARHSSICLSKMLSIVGLRARLVQLHEQLHEQLHNFNSQTTNSLPNSLVSFSENSLSQS
jgi:hypothetical protein